MGFSSYICVIWISLKIVSTGLTFLHSGPVAVSAWDDSASALSSMKRFPDTRNWESTGGPMDNTSRTTKRRQRIIIMVDVTYDEHDFFLLERQKSRTVNDSTCESTESRCPCCPQFSTFSVWIVGLHSTLAMEVGRTQTGKSLLMDKGFTYGIDRVTDRKTKYCYATFTRMQLNLQPTCD